MAPPKFPLPPRSGPNRGRGPPPPPPGYRGSHFLATAPRYGVEVLEMEGVDFFYHIILDDRAQPHLSGGSSFLLEHPFQRVVPKPPQIPEKTYVIIEIVIRATNTLPPILLQPAQEPLPSNDENTESNEVLVRTTTQLNLYID
jgi:hypothetical protein